MSTIIAIWNCWKVSDWKSKSAVQRLDAFRQAAFTASVEGDMQCHPGSRVQCIFVSPEYTFANADAGRAQAAEQVSANTFKKLCAAIKDVSRAYPRVLLVPGTCAALTETGTAENRCVVYLGGQQLCDFGKHGPVGEVVAGSGVTFEPGTGLGEFEIAGTRFGVQICRDATGAPNSVHFANNVHVQIVVGAGVGNVLDSGGTAAESIQNQYTSCQIVADWGQPGVYAWPLARIPVHSQGFAGGAPLTYYRLPFNL